MRTALRPAMILTVATGRVGRSEGRRVVVEGMNRKATENAFSQLGTIFAIKPAHAWFGLAAQIRQSRSAEREKIQRTQKSETVDSRTAGPRKPSAPSQGITKPPRQTHPSSARHSDKSHSGTRVVFTQPASRPARRTPTQSQH